MRALLFWLYLAFRMLLLSVALAFLLLPLPGLPSSLTMLNNLSFQRARGERIAKDALILEYRPADEHAGAISELQDTLPLWSQEQQAIASFPNSQVQLLLLQSDTDYTPMLQAAEVLLANQQHIDPIQVSIILSHEHGYAATINQLIILVQQEVTLDGQEFLIIESCFMGGSILLLLVGPGWTLLRRTVILKKQHQEEQH